MKIKITLLAFLLCSVGAVSAQVDQTQKIEEGLNIEIIDTISTGWRFGGVTNLNFSQLYLSNWAAGGQNSLALNGLVSLFGNYHKNALRWDNSLDLGYGFIRQEIDEQTKETRKTDDRIELNSKVGYKAFENFYYSGLVNFKTQFTDGYDYKIPLAERMPISKFFSPAYLTAALGLSYQPDNYFNVFLAPVTARFTFVTDEAIRPVYFKEEELDKAMKFEFGGYLRAVYSKNDFKAPVLRNISLTSKLDLFANYLDFQEFKDLDVSWEVLIAMQINKFLAVNISTNLIWDNDIILPGNDKAKVQFKELLGVGFTYNF